MGVLAKKWVIINGYESENVFEVSANSPYEAIDMAIDLGALVDGPASVNHFPYPVPGQRQPLVRKLIVDHYWEAARIREMHRERRRPEPPSSIDRAA